MRFSNTAAALATAALVAAQAPSIDDFTADQIANGEAFRNISHYADESIRSNIGSRTNTQCTYDNAAVRREWRDLPQQTRKSFTDAVVCLQNHAPTHMTSQEAPNYPGVKSRYDEFVATHINYTMNIHDTADFFTWHRAFIYYLEQDLINLCGYAGTLPYWNWAEDADAPQDSPLFNGDAYSIGGNGKFIAGRADTWLAQQDVTYPPGTGGGCIESGPFSEYTVNLGPLAVPNANNVNSSYQYNPHCLERDINPWFSTNYNTYEELTRVVLEEIYIENFQCVAQGMCGDNKFGVHGGGHWQIGGAMMDFHSSPADPLFYLHHTQVDKMWTVWQNLDIYHRQNIIRGTKTLGCSFPQCPEMTLDDIISFGFVAPDQTFSSLMDTFAGPFCYRYD